MINVIGKRHIYLTASAIVVGVAFLAIGIFGFKKGVDFSGGTLWQLQMQGGTENIAPLESQFKNEFHLSDVRVSFDASTQTFLARIPALTEADHQKFSAALKATYAGLQELSYQSIGPSVGAELEKNSLIALVLVLLGISLYIAFAFRKVYRPVSSWKYGWITLITLLHDVAIPAGLLAVLGHFASVEIDGNFIVALLVVMGFSVHDTIVVFDRIRENLFLNRGKDDFGHTVNESVNQTLGRSINTSFTLILVLIALYIVGPVALRYFILTLLLGVTTGIYSSIFVASPLLYVWQQWGVKKIEK